MRKHRNIFCGYCEFAENCEKHFFECDKHEVFVEIAQDQRKKDIEKAWKWMRSNIIVGGEKEHYNSFIKAMEEEQ